MKIERGMPDPGTPVVYEDGNGAYVVTYGPYLRVELDQREADRLAYELNSAIQRTLNP